MKVKLASWGDDPAPKPKPPKVITPKVLEKTIEGIAEGTAELINVAVAPLVARIEALEETLAEREWKGVYDPRVRYRKHNTTTFHGSLWLAVRDEPSTPGADPDGGGWKLVARKGKDARDGKDIARGY